MASSLVYCVLGTIGCGDEDALGTSSPTATGAATGTGVRPQPTSTTQEPVGTPNGGTTSSEESPTGAEGGGPTAGGSGAVRNPCSQLEELNWGGSQPCVPLNDYELFVVDRLSTVWRNAPSTICSYDGAIASFGPCGELVPGNALYCPIDHSIGYDARFMNQQVLLHGDFAAVTILAHEWGHVNQGTLGSEGPSTKALELHADCQAGMFAAVEESLGLLDAGDVCESFRSLCEFGDPGLAPWFAVGAHGTCEERIVAFEYGYFTAYERLPQICGPDVAFEVLNICGG